jgi:hypothetical protein
VYKGDYVVDTDGLLLPYVHVHSTHGNGEYREPKEVEKQAGIAKLYNKGFIMGEMSSTGTPAGSSSALPWTLTEMLSQVNGSQNIDALAYWQLLPPLTTHGDGWTMHWPGDNAAMTVRGNQFKDAAEFVNGGGFTNVVIAEAAWSATTSQRGRSVTFNSADWIPQTGDVVVMFCAGLSAVTMTTPAGWSNVLGGNTMVVSDANCLACVYREVTPTEISAGTMTYQAANIFDTATSGSKIGVVLRGVNLADPIDATGTAFNSGDTTTPHVLPGLSGASLSDNSLVISCVSNDATRTYTDLVGWGKIAAANTGSGAWAGLRNQPTTSGVDVSATNITPSTGDEFCAITVAFK